MNTKAQVREIAMVVSGGLTVYVAIHDKIFREAGSLSSVFKNLFGRGVPMSLLLSDAENLMPLWDSIVCRVETFRVKHAASLSGEEERYLEILSSYAEAVRRTVAALVERQRLANEGSKGGPENSLTLAAHRKRETEYQSAIQRYIAIGQELNAASPTIFS